MLRWPQNWRKDKMNLSTLILVDFPCGYIHIYRSTSKSIDLLLTGSQPVTWLWKLSDRLVELWLCLPGDFLFVFRDGEFLIFLFLFISLPSQYYLLVERILFRDLCDATRGLLWTNTPSPDEKQEMSYPYSILWMKSERVCLFVLVIFSL